MATTTNKPATPAKGTTAATPATVPPVNKSRHLQMMAVRGKTEDRLVADLVTDGLASNAGTAIRFAEPEHGDVSLTDLVASLREQGEAVNRGDLAAAERMLLAQAVALNTVFSEMARVAHLNLFKAPEWADRYLRLALKAQGQSRATVETLATIKNPPVVFARQANINNGGQQQVNNGVVQSSNVSANAPQDRGLVSGGASEPACGEISAIEPNKLLEASDGEQLDPRAQSASGGAHSDLAPVERLNRPQERSR